MQSAAVVMPRLVAKLRETWAEVERRRSAAGPAIRAAEASMRAEFEARRQTDRVPHLARCGVGGRDLEAFRGEKLAATPALVGLRAWLDGPPAKPFCVLAGGVGAGKSVAAAYSLLRATRRVRVTAHPLAQDQLEFEEYDSSKGLWLSAAQLRFAQRWADGKELALWDRCCTVRRLVVDELRREDLDGKGRARAEELLEERYATGRPTVITTNLGQVELKSLLGERLASRFAEGAVIVDSGDKDMRRNP